MHESLIKKRLSPYSIVRERGSTVVNAFAKAEASVDDIDLDAYRVALKNLYGEEPSGDLKCVYCDHPAKTWDHLYAVVKEGRYSGYGHRVRNLVPCCKDCNSSKQGRDWRDWLRSRRDRTLDVEERILRIERYAEGLVPDEESVIPDKLRERYSEIMRKVIALLTEADEVAAQIRSARRAAEEMLLRTRLETKVSTDGKAISQKLNSANQSASSRRRSVGERIVEVVRLSPNLRYGEIAERIRNEIPGVHTSAKSVASTIARARQDGRLPPS